MSSCDKGDSREPASASNAPAVSSNEANDCRSIKGDGEVVDLALAKCLAVSQPLKAWPRADPAALITVYFDRSRSMRGFLDPLYPTREPDDYRAVIDALIVGLSPSTAYGFGTGLREVKPSVGVVGQKGFYSDNDTRLEDALARVAADSQLVSSHVIIGDGRRGNPDTANEQYVRMRATAQRWTAKGGTFMTGASLAPFAPVKDDPAGCRGSEPGTTENRCPLYAFVFAAQGAETRLAEVLSNVFQHLYVWPLPAVPPGHLTLGATPSQDISLDRRWSTAHDSTAIIRTRVMKSTNIPLLGQLVLRDTLTPRARAMARAITSQDVRLEVAARALRPDAANVDWTASTGTAGLVRSRRDNASDLTLDIRTHGPEASRYLYRVDVVPTGRPAWIGEFDAADSRDAVRTYGIGRLFQAFEQEAQRQPQPAGRVYIVAN